MAHRSSRRLFFSFCVVVAFGAASSVGATGLFRAYLSGKGSDGNPCTVTAPCRLLPAALAAVTDGGEIWILDSANYNTAQVNVTRDVSILAVPGVVGSVVATGGDHALVIDAPGIGVTLRNLVFVSLGASQSGVVLKQGARLLVEDCEVANMALVGIGAATPVASTVTIRNTVLRDNGDFGFVAGPGPVTAVLDGVRILNNHHGVSAFDGTRVNVSNSTIANNAAGAEANSTTIPASLMVTRSILTGNGIAMEALAQSGTIASIVSDANVITFVSDTVFFFGNQGGNETIFTRENNTLGYFANLISAGHALTPLATF